MRLIVSAIGKLKKGPEEVLVGRYRDRITKSGPQLGISGIDIVEYGESRVPESCATQSGRS